MSLGQWFRDYVYIPMGGNRVSRGRFVLNILTVWLLTGLWHGADWTFVLWGLYFALFLLLEKLFLGRALERLPRLLSHLYVVFIILISFVLFNGDGISGAMRDISSLFGGGGLPLWTPLTTHYLKSYSVILIAALVGCTPIVKRSAERLFRSKAGEGALSVLQPVWCVGLLLLVTAYLVDGSFSAFLYFRF